MYFYPKDDTPGCTLEGQDFRDQHGEFEQAESACARRFARYAGVAREISGKYALPFELISDPDETLCRQFDVIKEKNMYGKKVLRHRAQHVPDRCRWRVAQASGVRSRSKGTSPRCSAAAAEL